MTVSKIVALSLVIAGIALGACRREEAYVPMKLGASVEAQQQDATR